MQNYFYHEMFQNFLIFTISDLILVQSKWNRQNQIRIQPKGIYPSFSQWPFDMPHTIWLRPYESYHFSLIDSILNRFWKAPNEILQRHLQVINQTQSSATEIKMRKTVIRWNLYLWKDCRKIIKIFESIYIITIIYYWWEVQGVLNTLYFSNVASARQDSF